MIQRTIDAVSRWIQPQNQSVEAVLLSERYRPIMPIAEGSFGAVWLVLKEAKLSRGRDKETYARWSKPYAIKILKEQSEYANLSRDLFIQEARLLSQFEHENIVEVTDSFSRGAYLALVMKFVDGLTLNNILNFRRRNNKGGISILNVLQIIRQVASGLHYAHTFQGRYGSERGILHQDIKPSNIILGMDGRVRLLDFGIAKTGQHSDKKEEFILGTPRYMAPEQARGEPLGPASDIYALGLVFYEMLTLDPLIRAYDPQAALEEASTLDARASVSTLASRYPRATSLLMAMLDPNFATRVQSACEIVDYIDELLSKEMRPPNLKRYIHFERNQIQQLDPELAPLNLDEILPEQGTSIAATLRPESLRALSPPWKLFLSLIGCSVFGGYWAADWIAQRLQPNGELPQMAEGEPERLVNGHEAMRDEQEYTGFARVKEEGGTGQSEGNDTSPGAKTDDGTLQGVYLSGQSDKNHLDGDPIDVEKSNDRGQGSQPVVASQQKTRNSGTKKPKNSPKVTHQPRRPKATSKSTSKTVKCGSNLLPGSILSGKVSLTGTPRPNNIAIKCNDTKIDLSGANFVYHLEPGSYHLSYRRGGTQIQHDIVIKADASCEVDKRNMKKGCG